MVLRFCLIPEINPSDAILARTYSARSSTIPPPLVTPSRAAQRNPMSEAPELIIYQLPPTWGLTSLSPACIQVQVGPLGLTALRHRGYLSDLQRRAIASFGVTFAQVVRDQQGFDVESLACPFISYRRT